MKNLYEILGVDQNSDNIIINHKFWDEILKYRPQSHPALDLFHSLPKREKDTDNKRSFELIVAFLILTDSERRQAYDKELATNRDFDLKDNPNIIDIQNINVVDFVQGFWDRCSAFASNSMSGGKICSEQHALKFHVLIESINLNSQRNFKQRLIIKDNFDPFLSYLDTLTHRLNSLKDKPLYASVDKKINLVSKEIKNSIESLDHYSTEEVVLKVLDTCMNILKQAQKDVEFNTHRGFLRRTPVFSHICFTLDVIKRTLNLLTSLVMYPYAIKKQEPYYGLFRQEKTKTASEIEALTQDVEAYMSFATKIAQFL